MAPLSVRFDVLNARSVPVILVAQALEDCHPAGPPQYSEWDGRPVQLYKVRVKVELVIQGHVGEKTLDVYYFVDQGASTGGIAHLRDILSGNSEVFFLQPDGDKLRTICDGWRNCVLSVRTGSHYKTSTDSNSTIYDMLMKILLGRGDQTSDQQMIDAINHPESTWGWKPVIKRLQEIAEKDQSRRVRAEALRNLQELRQKYGDGTEYIPDLSWGSFQ